jgi:hypothetical protein
MRQQPRGRRQPDGNAHGIEQLLAATAGRHNHLVGMDDALVGHDADHAVGLLHQPPDMGMVENLGTQGPGAGEKQPGRLGRFDRALRRNVVGVVGHDLQAGFDAPHLIRADAADPIAPAGVFPGEGIQLDRRQIPDQAAAPVHGKARNLAIQPSPFLHGTNAQVKIG